MDTKICTMDVEYGVLSLLERNGPLIVDVNDKQLKNIFRWQRSYVMACLTPVAGGCFQINRE
jgi:hypothetical protein